MSEKTKPTPEDPSNDSSVPAKIRPKYDAIWTLVEKFCRERLNDEYMAMCRRLLGVLARKRPSPLQNGTAAGWAAGVVRAIGHANFLHDKSQTPHLVTSEIDKGFGVSLATGQGKSKVIRDLLKIDPFSPEWTLPSKMKDNPLAYMIMVNGLIMDARHAPAEIQRDAVERGLIPPLPAGTAKYAVTDVAAKSPAGSPRLYTLDVWISEGVISKKFARKNPTVSRTIQIRGDQTLADLHESIFAAFDRFDAHLYEFQFGKGPHDPEGPKYRPQMPDDFMEEDKTIGVAEEATIDSLGLKVGGAFDYWFDFGDDWMHQIDVMAIDAAIPPGKYPKVTKRVGESPPQYLDEDEME